jgi:hypothetical protein
MTIQLDTVILPDDLDWTDEFESQSVSQTVRRTLDGGIVVYNGQNENGRSITLVSGDGSGWATRAIVKDVAALAAVPGGQYVLIIRGETFNVIFRHNDVPAFDSRPVVPFSDPTDTDFYTLSIKLITV